MRALYRLLLAAYPRAFRSRYRTELLDTFDADRAAARGARRTLEFWKYILADLFASAARLRGRAIAAAWHEFTGGGAPRLPQQPRRRFMETLAQDVRYAVRQFVRRPGFTAIAVLSLALGIGGTTLIYGILDGFVFNPFNYPQPDRLVVVGATFPKVSSETSYIEVLSPAEYLDIRKARSFAHLAAFDLGNRNISGGDVPERVFTAFLIDDLFPVIGLEPVIGRGFTRQELEPRGPNVAIISHRLWRSRFAADPKILERPIRIGGVATSIVGVMPPDLLLIGADLWMPWGADPAAMPRNMRQFTIIGRLAPDASLASANAELASIAGQVQAAEGAALKEYEGWRMTATPWAAALLQDVRPAAAILLVAISFVLLIACANLTNLMLARSTSRGRELAVRLALGAGRWRIARQLLTESLLLAVVGAAAGLGLTALGLHFSERLIPAQFVNFGLEARLSLRVVGWSVVLALVAGVLVALLPALQASRTDPHESLKADARGGLSKTGLRLRQSLIIGEIALSVVLLLTAGLLMRTVMNIQAAPLGFNASSMLTMRLTLPQPKYPTAETTTAFFERLVQRVQSEPGVVSAAMASQFPPSGMFTGRVEVEGVQAAQGTLPTAQTTIASRDYFRTLDVPVRRGRAFTTEEQFGGPARVVVNEAFVRRFLADRDPLTSRIRIVGRRTPGPWAEIVGVVADARNTGAAAPVRPEVFIPMEQGRDAWNQLYLLVRTNGTPSAVLPAMRAAVSSIDAEQPVYAIQTMEEVVALSSFQQRIAGILLGVFAAVALILAAIGIYGVMSYAVTARTQEIGVRMALGAERAQVIGLVLRQVAAMAVIGLLIGTGLLLAAGKVLAELLHGVRPADPVTIALVTLTLGAVALLAGWVPAWRASRVNPINALRYE